MNLLEQDVHLTNRLDLARGVWGFHPGELSRHPRLKKSTASWSKWMLQVKFGREQRASLASFVGVKFVHRGTLHRYAVLQDSFLGGEITFGVLMTFRTFPSPMTGKMLPNEILASQALAISAQLAADRFHRSETLPCRRPVTRKKCRIPRCRSEVSFTATPSDVVRRRCVGAAVYQRKKTPAKFLPKKCFFKLP